MNILIPMDESSLRSGCGTWEVLAGQAGDPAVTVSLPIILEVVPIRNVLAAPIDQRVVETVMVEEHVYYRARRPGHEAALADCCAGGIRVFIQEDHRSS